MPTFTKSLFGQVMVALVLGVVVGVFWPDFAAQMKPLGDGFIKLIKMVIAPLVFGVVVHGIASAGDLKKVGRVGVKSIVYFEVVTTIALDPRHRRRLRRRPGPRDEHRHEHPRRQRALDLHRAHEGDPRRGRLPAQHHPLDLRRRLRQRRHPAGAGARGALRRGPQPLRRAGAAGDPPHRPRDAKSSSRSSASSSGWPRSASSAPSPTRSAPTASARCSSSGCSSSSTT